MSDLLTTKEGAAILRMSRKTFARLLRDRLIPHAVIGKRKTVVSRADLEEYLRKSMVGTK